MAEKRILCVCDENNDGIIYSYLKEKYLQRSPSSLPVTNLYTALKRIDSGRYKGIILEDIFIHGKKRSSDEWALISGISILTESKEKGLYRLVCLKETEEKMIKNLFPGLLEKDGKLEIISKDKNGIVDPYKNSCIIKGFILKRYHSSP